MDVHKTGKQIHRLEMSNGITAVYTDQFNTFQTNRTLDSIGCFFCHGFTVLQKATHFNSWNLCCILKLWVGARTNVGVVLSDHVVDIVM